MSSLNEVTVATSGEGKINLQEVLSSLKLGGHMAFLGEAIRNITVLRIAEQEGITASIEEIQAELDSFRRRMKLTKKAEVLAWMEGCSYSLDDLEERIRRFVISSKLKARVIDNDLAQRYFDAHPEEFQWANMAELICQSHASAQAIEAELRAGASMDAVIAKHAGGSGEVALGQLGKASRAK